MARPSHPLILSEMGRFLHPGRWRAGEIGGARGGLFLARNDSRARPRRGRLVMSRPGRLSLVLCLARALGPGACPARAGGEPLPAGALARMGSLRLRAPEEIGSVVLSPDGKRLATLGRDPAALRVWDAASGKPLWGLPGGPTPITSPLVFAGGKFLAAGV